MSVDSEPIRTTRFRWTVVAMLLGMSIVSYVERVNLSVAGELIMKEFQLRTTSMGLVFGSFLVAYTLFQVPAGQLADRFGPRVLLASAASAWALCTLLAGLIPGFVFSSATGVFTSLLILRFLLGVAEAPTYPAAGRAIANWLPNSERALANAIVLTGAALGSAVTTPLVSQLMVAYGWRNALFLIALPAVFIALVWWLYFRDDPRRHHRVSGAELVIIGGRSEDSGSSAQVCWSRFFKGKSFWALSMSYFLHSYVTYIFIFWFYIYLVEVRGFNLLSGGAFASAPFIVATILSPVGGAVCDWSSRRYGNLWGRRVVPCIVIPSAALLVFWAGRSVDPYLAVALFSLAAGLAWAAEGVFWASMIDIAGRSSGSAGGLLNMVGNVGGALSAILTPWIAEYVGWVNVFNIASMMGLLGALLWLWVDSEQSIESATSLAPANEVSQG